jgi:protease-4
MDQRHEYKNAMNLYTETAFTDAHREATSVLMNSQFGQIVRGIAEARDLSEEQVRGLADRGAHLAQEALDAGLVDGLAYRDEVLDALRGKTDARAELLDVTHYLDRAGRAWRRGRGIALVFGVGAIHRGKSTFDPFTEMVTMGSDSAASAIRAAVADDDIEAIVFRVDCPGGSYVGSDAVYREVVRAREAGKPVIVTMGNVAGSGGYFVAIEADAIVAQPGTITASIGVLAGKLLTTAMWDKVGLSFDEVHTSENSTLYSFHHDYSESEWERLQAFLDRIYEDFTGKVAAGREIPIEDVRKIAKGRIWTGEDALRLGLVDHLGGILTAIEVAREAAGIGADEAIHLRTFPREKTLFQTLTARSPDSSDQEGAAAIVAQAMESLRPYARLAQRLGLSEPRGVLSMPALLPEGAP